MKRRLARAAPLLVVLVGVWLLLQGTLTIANVLGGLILGGFLAWVFPVSDPRVHHRLHPWAFLRFIGFVLASLVLSSWEVIKIIVRPTPTSLRSGIVRVRLEHESPITTTIVANAVTLTPGTMTLTARLDPAELHIHALGLGDPEEFRASVHDLERRTVAALTPEPGASDPRGEAPDRDGAGDEGRRR
jgi:multicomponent Na+:H+ antiporter subunit E